MDDLSKPPRRPLDDIRSRVATAFARQRARFNDHVDFLQRLDRNGEGVLVPVIRRRSPAGRVSGDR